MYVSLHGVGDAAKGAYFYPDTATELQVEERLVNVPLPQGTTSQAYLDAFDAHVAPNLRRFAPDLVLISCGFDLTFPRRLSPSLTFSRLLSPSLAWRAPRSASSRTGSSTRCATPSTLP